MESLSLTPPGNAFQGDGATYLKARGGGDVVTAAAQFVLPLVLMIMLVAVVMIVMLLKSLLVSTQFN